MITMEEISMKPCYADYVTHAMRFYAKHTNLKVFPTMADANNWRACHVAISACSPTTREYLMELYVDDRPLNEVIPILACKYRMTNGQMWQAVNRFAKTVARLRGLI